MSEITGSSGAKIVISPASWKDAKKLKMAVQKEAALSTGEIDLKADIASMVGTILRLDGSDAVDAALWPCLIRCTRNNEKITEATFDDLEARKDYYDILLECAKVNFGPLWASLASKLPPGLLKTPEDIQKLN